MTGGAPKSPHAEMVRRLLEILRYVDAHPGCTSPQMVAGTGVPKATLYRLLDLLWDAYGVRLESDGGQYRMRSWGILSGPRIRDQSPGGL